jgi:hypothetical protein
LKSICINPASFRDPAGFIFVKDGVLFRQINKIYAEEFDALSGSGLLGFLQDRGLLVNHKDADINNAATSDAYRVLKPDLVPFISYPYEWSFSQLKDAALLTLEIQKESLARGMTLKDASAFNVQFIGCKPVFIDTLSFERYKEGSPWIAYGQFCRHFLAPLALMSYRNVGMGNLFKTYLDGLPLSMTNSLLPFSALTNMGILIHIMIHSAKGKRAIKAGYSAQDPMKPRKASPPIKLIGLMGIIESLKNTIDKLRWRPVGTEWSEYYQNTNYAGSALVQKKIIILKAMEMVQPQVVWDIGANNGFFSKLATQKHIRTIAFDMDPAAVELNYLSCKASPETDMLPLLMDISNPSPELGWNNKERLNLRQRGHADLVFALAITHHLAIGNNVPFKMIAEFFASICRFLLIEFVPKTDSKVRGMLEHRRDIFKDYSESGFIEAFRSFFDVQERFPIQESERVIFLMRKIER